MPAVAFQLFPIMSYLLNNFHEAVRALVGDEGDLATGYDYAEAQLSAALRTVVRMGQVPSLAMAASADALAAEPGNPDTWGYLAARAAHVLIGGATPVNLRTRAISLSTDPSARRDALSYIETMISEIDSRGNVGGTAADTGTKGLFGTMGDLMTHCGCGHPAARVPLYPPAPPHPRYV